MTVSWLLYPTISAPMPFQMALDEIFFREMAESGVPRENQKPALRFYYSSEPWISLGYAYAGWKRPAGERLQVELSSAAEGPPLCRRMTGGGRVLHGRDLMFTIIAPKAAHDSFSSVEGSYRRLHEVVKAAVEELGRKPRFYRPEGELPRGKDCFLFPIETDLELNGEKIAGGGQKRSVGIMMHQESIRLERLGDPEVFRDCLERNFEKTFEMKLEPACFSPELFVAAEKLGNEKYWINRPSRESL